MVRDGKRAGGHHSSEEAVEACLPDEVDKVGSKTERHAASLAFEVSRLDLFHCLAPENLWQLVAGLQSRIAETQSAGALAEAHGCQSLELCLVEGIREKGIGSMISRETLLEEEQVVNIIEDPVEV